MALRNSIGISARALRRIRLLAQDVATTRWRDGFEPCEYCGVIANSIDHVPPLSARGRLIDLGLVGRYPFHEVFACRECNSALGARGLWRLPERRRYIIRWLQRNYADMLRIPEWSDAELGQLSPQMREFVLSGLAVRDFIRQRLAYARSRTH